MVHVFGAEDVEHMMDKVPNHQVLAQARKEDTMREVVAAADSMDNTVAGVALVAQKVMSERDLGTDA